MSEVERSDAVRECYERAMGCFMRELLAGLTPDMARGLCPSARSHGGVLLFVDDERDGGSREGSVLKVVVEFGSVVPRDVLELDPRFGEAVRVSPRPWAGATPGKSLVPVELRWSLEVVIRAYKSALKIHEAAGQRIATMLMLAAFICYSHTKMVGCSFDETFAIVRGQIDELSRRMP